MRPAPKPPAPPPAREKRSSAPWSDRALKLPPQRWRLTLRECSIALVGRRLFAVCVVIATVCPAGAAAAPVLVMGPGHRVLARNDPFLSSASSTPMPATRVVERARVAARAHRRRPRPPARTASSELARLRRTGAITSAAYRSYSASLHKAIATVRRLRGTRARELNAVLANLHDMAVR